MTQPDSAGKRFRAVVESEQPTQIVGTINAYTAMLARDAGFRAVYLSGAGVANASYGLPDLGLTTLDDVLIDARRVARATELPLLVDADTGWGSSAETARTVRGLIDAGAGAMHLEDQIDAKKCGHLPGKRLVSTDEMIDRLRAALDARTDPAFVIMARTDAYSVEGLDAAIHRADRYVEAGADMIFAEAMSSLDDYRRFTGAIKVPVLANLTEFGKTPLFSLDEMRSAGVRLVLYPLTAFRAMNAAALNVYRTVRREGTQRSLTDQMQTREDLYRVLDYYAFEKRLADKAAKETKP
ncbi:MAG: methylisocitrate lyase [Planctomycetes bacterium]|nr:methylisocitrate lyase [Planctomycetota bacterium]